jgi:hypothetical protein
VVVAGELPREAHNAPLHLFSASPDLVGFGGDSYRRRSERTTQLLDQLFGRFRGEGLIMPYTMEDFQRDYIKEHFPELTREDREDVLRALPAEERLAGLPAKELVAVLPAEELAAVLPVEARLAGLPLEQIRQYLDRATAGHKIRSRQPRRKK